MLSPLNPKWILADKGLKQVYDKMIASNDKSIQRSLETWYPRKPGIREQMEAIHARHPDGFVNGGDQKVECVALVQEMLRRQMVSDQAKTKVRNAMTSISAVKVLVTPGDGFKVRYDEESELSQKVNPPTATTGTYSSLVTGNYSSVVVILDGEQADSVEQQQLIDNLQQDHRKDSIELGRGDFARVKKICILATISEGVG